MVTKFETIPPLFKVSLIILVVSVLFEETENPGKIICRQYSCSGWN
jgi:hypothetical protein